MKRFMPVALERISAMVSVIVVTYNSSLYIEACLDSVFTQCFENCEIIVVDNGSQDSTLSIISGKYPFVKVIKNGSNVGASKARNLGIDSARGEFILCLDSDIVLMKDFILSMYTGIQEADNIGMVQPKVLREDAETIDTAGIFLSKIRRFHDIGRGMRDKGCFDSARDVFGACSAAVLYRRKMLEEIKVTEEYFDEDFFFLVEDVDLSWRAKTLGWRCVFRPRAQCLHHGNSSNSNQKFRQYLCFRNRYFLLIKNDRLRSLFFIFPYELVRIPYFLLKSQNAFKAFVESINLIPKMLKKRMLIREALLRKCL